MLKKGLQIVIVMVAALGLYVCSKQLGNFLLSVKASSGNITPLPNGPIGNSYNWSLIFSDEFNSSPVDTTKWSPCIYWGITKDGCYENLSQLEWYKTSNSTIANDLLTIQARKETTKTQKGTFAYTSGLITSDRNTSDTTVPVKFDFQYGYAEIRAKVPTGKGLWPAFWMLPTDHSNGEIDIMEILGDHPETNYMTYHWGNGQSIGGSWSISGTDFSKDFHTYAVDWNPDSIVWYIDGVERYRLSDASIIPQKRLDLIANLQIGGSWAGNPDRNTVFPANYDIDYIRVWKKGLPISTPTPTATPTISPTAMPTSTNNLLLNPSFEAGVSPWSLDVKTGAAANISLDPSSAFHGKYSTVINTTKSSTTDWYVQLTQNKLVLNKGQIYNLSFTARSETSRTIPVIIQNDNNPYTEYSRQNVSLTPDWQTFNISFTLPVDLSNAKLSFSLGKKTGKIWFDQLSLGN